MITKCYSVRLDSLYSYSEKSYKATSFNGRVGFIPKRCVFGQDFEVYKCEAYWIAAWFLERSDLQYSSKKVAYFDENGKMIPKVIKEKHEPDTVQAVTSNDITELKKQ